ncbi:MAG TPA: hypothetical protein VIJ62_12085, partial [Rhizomicrobium sp.]
MHNTPQGYACDADFRIIIWKTWGFRRFLDVPGSDFFLAVHMTSRHIIAVRHRGFLSALPLPF